MVWKHFSVTESECRYADSNWEVFHDNQMGLVPEKIHSSKAWHCNWYHYIVFPINWNCKQHCRASDPNIWKMLLCFHQKKRIYPNKRSNLYHHDHHVDCLLYENCIFFVERKKICSNKHRTKSESVQSHEENNCAGYIGCHHLHYHNSSCSNLPFSVINSSWWWCYKKSGAHLRHLFIYLLL